MGPQLFCVFANDLSLFAKDAVMVQYAADTQALVSGPKSDFQNVIARLERFLTSLDIWFHFNGLKIIVDKTQPMLLGNQQNLRTFPPFQVKFRDQVLVPRPETKKKKSRPSFCCYLNWNSHISLITKRCFGILSSYKNAGPTCTDHTDCNLSALFTSAQGNHVQRRHVDHAVKWPT